MGVGVCPVVGGCWSGPVGGVAGVSKQSRRASRIVSRLFLGGGGFAFVLLIGCGIVSLSCWVVVGGGCCTVWVVSWWLLSLMHLCVLLGFVEGVVACSVLVVGLSSAFCRFCLFSHLCGCCWDFQGEVVVPLVRSMHHLVKVFGGQLLLCKVVDVGSCMSEVVGGPVCGVYHVRLFEGVLGGGV